MICRYNRLLVLSAGVLILFFTGCKKLTDEHNAITDGALNNNLSQLVGSNPNLSIFAGYLKQTGLDSVVSSSRNYTVFAPVNAALQGLDPAIISSPEKLKKFVGNHIANQLFAATGTPSKKRILMLNGKYHNMLGSGIEDATITIADQYASNGLLQVIDKALPALDNIWEFISSNPNAPAKQKAFMLSLFQKVFDTSKAVITGIDPLTGAPVYQPGTDSIFTNLFWNRVYDLRDEKKQFTVFMLRDAAWDLEVNKYAPYFVTGTTDSTTRIASFNVLKDMAIDTVYNPSTIPATILSKFKTTVPVDRLSIVQTIKTSNGIIYIMDKLNVAPQSKFKEYFIQAENYSATSANRRGNTFFREKNNPVTGLDYRDVLVLNHGLALFNIRYDITEVPSIKYKAYWVAVNDFQAVTFSQRLSIGSTLAASFPYTVVPVNNFNEVYLGEFTNTAYRPVYNIFLVAANSTAAAANPLVCDYIKLVPSL